MSAAIAMVPSPAPHVRAPVPEISTAASAPSQAPSAASPTQKPTSATTTSPSSAAQRPESISPRSSANKTGNTSPTASRNDALNSKVVIKKEPKSPGDAAPPASRPRPSKLDLSKNKGIPTGNAPATSLGLPGRDGLGIQEVGIACLSPGFVTQNPVMKEQLQRSMSVRDQQLKIIEARLHQQPSKPDTSSSQTFPATPGLSNRKKNRPGPIVAPNHGQFRGDRGIQSAPLGHSFAQQHHQPSYPGRHNPSQYGHHHPSQHPANKLPPISDVFNHGPPPQHAEPYRGQRPLASPGHPPPPPPPPHHHAQPQGGYPQRGERDYKSAEEAQQELAAGRPELLPKIVHYGGHQPPTPPSPIGASRAGHKRIREDYEHGSSPPLGTGPAPRRGPFGAGIDSPRTQQAKRDEFLRLCERAWDLFHS